MFFSVTNKNLNLEIITKNLVTSKLLKDEMKLRMKNFNIMGVQFAKNQNMEGQIG